MDARFACFIGWSNTGKTGFVEQCITALRANGISVGAIKCVHHGASFNLPGKDSTRFFSAGATAALVSDDETVRIESTPGSWGREYARSVFPVGEVILVEGRLLPGAVRVLVGGPATTRDELKRPLTEFDVLITDAADLAEVAKHAGLVVFGSDQARLFTEHYFSGGNEMKDRTVTVTNGGKDVPLNPFVKETFENVVLGLMKPLKDVTLDQEIIIKISALQ
ncbi:MAG TPA: molybdopterin-guanine dinucleotide biosynthesis protein MobB [bacterium]|nr:molybdopterin-guanine dinucleotide biosynthesis protein MobB [bacterium]